MGNHLSERRVELGLTQKELARAVGVSEGTISKWESGAIINIRRDKVNVLADVLKTTPYYIMTGEQEVNPFAKSANNGFNSLCEKVREMQAEMVYEEATNYCKPGTEQTCRDLYGYLNMMAYQDDKDTLESKVTIRDQNASVEFRIPEELMKDQIDVTSHFVAILGAMPAHTRVEKQQKIGLLAQFLNAEGKDKLLTYVEDLVSLPKYQVELRPIKD